MGEIEVRGKLKVKGMQKENIKEEPVETTKEAEKMSGRRDQGK